MRIRSPRDDRDDARSRRAALRDARVLVVGLGHSGVAATTVLTELGARVVAIDSRPEVAEHAREVLPAATVLGGADPHALIERALASSPRLVVASPGLAPTSPLLAGPRALGIETWSEVELGWRVSPDDAPWLAITGTNGKTTTVGMLSEILAAGGLHAPAVGNVGEAVSTAALFGLPDAAGRTRPLEAFALEASSFQLHHTKTLSPLASTCLNVSEDHLDWYESMDSYRRDKSLVYQHTSGACVYPSADDEIRAMVERAEVLEGARAIGVSLGAPAVGELGLVEDLLVDRAFTVDRAHRAEELARLDDLGHLRAAGALPGHVVANALFAAALARAAGVGADAVAAGLRGFRPGGHRIETVAVIDEVAWINDSKATNAHAADASLASMEAGRTVWIAGGMAKGSRFDDLVRARRDRLRAVVLIGLDRAPWTDALARHAPDVPVFEVRADETGQVMTVAIAQARQLARAGDTVLLAPAGASMDQFGSYAERGRLFAEAVGELARRRGSES